MDHDWVEVRTAHFTFFSDLEPRFATESARQLERLREVLSRTSPGMNPDPDRPFRVFLFRDSTGCSPYGHASDLGAAGYELPTRDAIYVVLRPDERGALRILFHEYLHAFLHASIGVPPPWLDEGLAEYSSTFRVSGTSAEVGHAVPENLLLLRGGDVLSLGHLLVSAGTRQISRSMRSGGRSSMPNRGRSFTTCSQHDCREQAVAP